MNKDKLISTVLIGGTVIASIAWVKSMIDTAYIKGQNDQLEKSTKDIEECTERIKNILNENES